MKFLRLALVMLAVASAAPTQVADEAFQADDQARPPTPWGQCITLESAPCGSRTGLP